MNAEVQSLLRQGELEQAIGLMNAEVRANPSDVARRSALAELLCLAGNLERADTILDSVSSLDVSTAIPIAMFRQLVRAEQARQQFYADGRVPEFLGKPGMLLELELRAALATRDGALDEAAALVGERDEKRAAVAGTADGVAFDDFRDLDDLSAAHLNRLREKAAAAGAADRVVEVHAGFPAQRCRDVGQGAGDTGRKQNAHMTLVLPR